MIAGYPLQLDLTKPFFFEFTSFFSNVNKRILTKDDFLCFLASYHFNQGTESQHAAYRPSTKPNSYKPTATGQAILE